MFMDLHNIYSHMKLGKTFVRMDLMDIYCNIKPVVIFKVRSKIRKITVKIRYFSI